MYLAAKAQGLYTEPKRREVGWTVPRFRVILEGQLGPRESFLRLEAAGTRVTGSFFLFGVENPVTGERTGENRVCLTHGLHTAVSDLLCRTVLELGPEQVSGTVFTPMGELTLHGERLDGAQVTEVSFSELSPRQSEENV